MRYSTQGEVSAGTIGAMGRWDLVVMAAGVGSRFGGLKQLEPVGGAGEALLDFTVFDAARAGAERVVVVVRREVEEAFHTTLGHRWGSRLEVTYVRQELTDLPEGYTPLAGRSKPWGTGHAVLAARGVVRGPFVVVNADDFYGAEGFELLARFLSENSPPAPGQYALVAYRLGHTLSEHGAVSRGVCRVDGGGQLVAIEEREGVVRRADGSVWSAGAGEPVELSPDALVSMNLWGFQPDLFSRLQERFVAFLARRGDDPAAEFYLPTAVTDLLAAGLVRVQVFPTSSPWFGLTYRNDTLAVRRHLRQLVAQGLYPPRLWP